MIKGIVAGLLFSLACIASGAWGESKDLNLVYIDGFHALPMERIPEVLSIASHYFNKVGIVFRIKILAKPNPCFLFHALEFRELEIRCFAQDARMNGYTRHRKLTYYIIPPYISDSKFWIAGMTEKLGGVVAVGNAEEVNQNGVIRVAESGTVLAHETFHMLSATHNSNKPNLMHPNALIYVKQGEWLPVLRSSKRQVARFLNRRK